jgi:hypothetical protein
MYAGEIDHLFGAAPILIGYFRSGPFTNRP